MEERVGGWPVEQKITKRQHSGKVGSQDGQ